MDVYKLLEVSNVKLSNQLKGNVEVLQNLIDDSFSYVDSTGRQFDKSTYIDQYADLVNIRWHEVEILTYKEYVDKNLGWVQISSEEKFEIASTIYQGRFWNNHLYLKKDNEWLWVGGQSTMLQEAE